MAVSSDNIKYRDANDDDISFMKDMLIEACFASGVESINVDNLSEYPETEINIKGWNPDVEPGIIAETELGIPVGAVWLRYLPELEHFVDEEILPEITIAVTPLYRRKGVARNLMHELYRKCAENNIMRIRLGVHNRNVPALGLYQKEGWMKDGSFKDYIMMSKRIE